MRELERQKNILSLLRKGVQTLDGLALRFGVSKKTIQRDIEYLSIFEPIYTQSGRYGGGIYMNKPYDGPRIVLTKEQYRLMTEIAEEICTEKRLLMDSIMDKLSCPENLQAKREEE